MYDWLTLILLALSLSMDAFAVSVCNGLSITQLNKKNMLFQSAVFGLMQGLMPLIGYLLGGLFLNYFSSYLKWISFGLLLLIGGKMLFEGVKELRGHDTAEEKTFSIATTLIQGVATSIDALAVGVSLLGFSISIYIGAPVIAAVTFTACLVGVVLGKKFGKRLLGKSGIATLVGGIVLVLLGGSFLFR